MELEESAKHWRELAQRSRDKAEWDRSIGIAPKDVKVAADHQAELYDQTARSIELEIETGKWHCVCHLSPSCPSQRR